MLKAIVQLIAIGEAIVGGSLTVLLLAGRTDPITVANTLTVAGVVVLLVGAAPSMVSVGFRRMGGPQRATALEVGSGSLKSPSLRTNAFTSRAGSFVRGLLIAGIVIGTGLLLYLFPSTP